jgi:hypothetical protein
MPRIPQPEQEAVAQIHHSFHTPIPEEVPITRVEESVLLNQQPVAYKTPATVYKPVYASPQPEGRILRERRVNKKKKPSVALQALLISIAGIAIVIALIGSGQFDAFLSQNKLQYAPINFLGGENVVNNASK